MITASHIVVLDVCQPWQMCHPIFPQVCTVVTKHSITSDPTTNQSAYATYSNTPPRYSKSPPFVNPSPPITIPKKSPPPNNVLRTLRSAQSNHPPPLPSKLVQPKLQDRELEYAVSVREVHRGRQENVARGATKPMSLFMQNASKKPPDPLCNFPLYDKVDPDQPVVVEPLLPRQSADAIMTCGRSLSSHSCQCLIHTSKLKWMNMCMTKLGTNIYRL